MTIHPEQKSVLLILLWILPCCGDTVFGRVTINDQEYNLQVKECVVSETEEEPVVYLLSIELEDPSRSVCSSIRFSVQDPKNDKTNLLAEGAHAATGSHWDGIRFNLLESCNSYYHNGVTSAEMEIVWEQISQQTIAPDLSYYTGEGLIRIKQPIQVSFPNFDHTYPEQQINVACPSVRIP